MEKIFKIDPSTENFVVNGVMSEAVEFLCNNRAEDMLTIFTVAGEDRYIIQENFNQGHVASVLITVAPIDGNIDIILNKQYNMKTRNKATNTALWDGYIKDIEDALNKRLKKFLQ